jgi:DNA-binding response OmpR family regulator
LRYFLANPKVFLTKTEIIANSWPEEIHRAGVSDDALYQLICSLRRKLQCDPFAHCNYIRNWRGSRDEPEGGYRFFPDGQTGTWVEAANGARANQLPENDTQQLLEQLEQLIENFKNGNGQSSNNARLNGNSLVRNRQNEPLIQVYGIGHRVTIAQTAIRVSGQEFRCLRILAQRTGSTVDYDDLIKAVWDSEYVNKNCVYNMITRLRDKLGPYATYLQTCHGKGYSLQCAVYYSDKPWQT